MKIPSRLKTVICLFSSLFLSPVLSFSLPDNFPIDADVPVYYKEIDALVFNWKSNVVTGNNDLLFELYFIDPVSEKKQLIYNSIVQTNKVSLVKPRDVLKEGGTYCYFITENNVNNNLKSAGRIPVYFNYWPECSEISNPVLDDSKPGVISVTWEDLHKNEAYAYVIRYRYWEDEDIEPSWQQIEVHKTYCELPVIDSKLSVDIQIKRICRYQNGLQISSNWTDIGQLVLQSGERGLSCSRLTTFTIDSVTKSSFRVTLSTDIDANQSFGPWYTVYYKPSSQATWDSVYILSGKKVKITGLAANTEYNVKARTTFGGSDYRHPTTFCSALSTQNVTTLDWVNWQNYDCGDSATFTYPNAPGIAALHVGDYLEIAGFNVKLTTVSGGSGTFSGEAIVPIPFGQKKIAVEFSNITVDTNRVVKNGILRLITDAGKMAALKDSIADNPLGSFECAKIEDDPNTINEELGHNEYGFDSTGHYVMHPPYPGWVPGMPYDSLLDPYGFDANGINNLTDSIYDQFGCDRNGLTVDNKPCDHGGNIPYYWMYDKTPTSEGIDYFNDRKDSIRVMIIRALNELIAQNNDKIHETRQTCSGIRDSLVMLADDKSLDKAFLFGADSLYLKEGMHSHFTKEPVKYSNYTARDKDILLMEKTHYNLYHCDKYLQEYLDMKNLLEDNLSDVNIDKILAKIKELITSLDSTKLLTISNYSALYDSVYVFVRNDLIKQYYDIHNISYSSVEQTETIPTNLDELIPKSSFKLRSTGCGLIDDGIQQLIQKFNRSGAIKAEDQNTAMRRRALYIEELIAQREKNRTEDQFLTGGDDALTGPILLGKEIASGFYSIYLDSIEISPDGATLDAYFILPALPSGNKLVFGLKNVHFSTTGLVGASDLVLLTSQPFPVGKAMRVIVNGGQNLTHISWDCTGFKEIYLDADLEFCREYVTPLNATTFEPLPEPALLTTHFSLEMESWNDLLINVDIPPFELTNHPDYKFEIDDAWLDLSDSSNPDSLVFPKYYTHYAKNSPLWEGVYFRRLEVRMPDYMKSCSQNELKLNIRNFVFDDLGVSGTIAASPILPLSCGSINGWAFSIDSAEVVVTHNRFKEGFMKGYLNVPLLTGKTSSPEAPISEQDCYTYAASMDSYGNYMFEVGIKKQFKIPLLFAPITIINPTITIASKNGVFEATALLNGTIVSDTSIGGIDFSFDTIHFENVILSTKAPFIKSVGTWKFPSIQRKFAGFEINISEISLKGTNNKIELHVHAQASLSTPGVALTAGLSFSILGRLDNSGVHHKWVYDDFIVDGVDIGGSCTGIAKIVGHLKFFKENTNYGNGFQGAVGVKFEKLSFEINALALFGKKDGLKYCMVDTRLRFPGNGVPLIAPFNMMALGGGFWHNMTPAEYNSVDLASAPGENSEGDINNISIGTSLSGVHYTPANNDVTGIRFSVGFNVGDPKMLNGNVSLIMVFTGASGLQSIELNGNAKFMGDLDLGGNFDFHADGGDPHNGAPISAYVSIKYNFDLNVLDAHFISFLNYGSLISGYETGGKFAEVNLHFDKDHWWVWLGTPQSRAGIKMDLFGSLKIDTYFDIGDSLPPPATLNENLAKFFGVPADFAQASFVKSGGGFMHGSNLVWEFKKTFWIFTLESALNIGYDLAVLNYGDAVCTNKDPDAKVGINGWYASGQLWVYVKASLKYKIKIWFVTKSGTILNVEAGVLLRAQLPNPTWAQGVLKLKYNVLGIIKGSASFDIEIGEKCKMATSNGKEVNPIFDIISYTTPEAETTNNPVNCIPEVGFNYSIGGRKISYDKFSGEGTNTYYFKLLNSYIYYIDDTYDYERLVPCTQVWNADSTVLKFVPTDFLAPNKTYNMYLYVVAYKNGSPNKSESDTITWTTGVRPNNIPLSNIDESYPQVDRMNFFLHEEDCNHGYIKLKAGQDYLMRQLPVNAINVLRVTDPANTVLYQENLKYDCAHSTINFDINWAGILSPGQNYKIQVVQTFGPKANDNGADFNKLTGELETRGVRTEGPPSPNHFPTGSPTGSGGFDGCDKFKDPSLDTITQEVVLLKYKFRTSIYDNMKEKLDATFGSGLHPSSLEDSIYTYNLTNEEGFDYYELKGFNNLKPFLEVGMDPESPSWFDKYKPIYESKPYGIKTNYAYPSPPEEKFIKTTEEEESNEPGDILKDNFIIGASEFFNDTSSNFSAEKNVNIASYQIKYSLPKLVSNDLNFLRIKLMKKYGTCTSIITPPFFRGTPIECEQKIYYPSGDTYNIMFKTGSYKPIFGNSFPIEINFNDKQKTNKGIAVYKYSLKTN